MTDDSDSLLRRLFEATPDALWLIGLDGETLMANQRFADMVGHPYESITEMSGYVIADEQGKSDFERHMQMMRSGHPGVDNEDVLVVRRDGTTIWVLSSWSPVRDEAGNHVIGYIHRLTEHTERRRLLDALQDREIQLANAQRIARLGSWTWDVETDDVRWSPELYEIRGVDRAVFVPTFAGVAELWHPDDRDAFSNNVLKAMSHQDRYVLEARTVTQGGEIRWIRAIGEIERDADGAVVRLHGTEQDVTERRQALEAAEAATQNLMLLQQLAEAANRSSTLADALVRSAKLLTEHSGWKPLCVFVRTERGGPLTTLVLPEPAAPDLPDPDFALAELAYRTREVGITPASATTSLMTIPVTSGRSMACVIQVVGDSSVGDTSTWSLVRQVSDQLSRVAERERTAQQVAEARDEAMAASRHKSEFLATMSHEIRTPMNGVIGLTDLLLRSSLDDQQRRLAEGLRGAGLTLLSLINDILDLSKIESGKLELEAIDFDVRGVVEETAMILAGPARDKGIELIVGCAPDVPVLLRGDPVRLGQVLTNLGSNAVKFTEAGEVVVDVQVAGTVPHDDATGPGAGDDVVLRVEVRDTGIGIGGDQVDGLFDAFTQADRSTTRQHGGTGLGLAISRQLVEGMGGEIGVHSSPGAGSVFWFTARLGAVAAGTDTAMDHPLRRRRVLVVDDSPTAGSFLVRQLAAWQLQVLQVGSVREAMTALDTAAAEGTPYDVALVDLELGDGEGLDLGRHVAGSATPVDLVLLAGEGEVTEDQLHEAGFRSRVSKPVRAGELYAALLDPADPEPVTTGRRPARPAQPDQPDLALRVLVVEDNAVNQLVATGLLENLGCAVVAVGNGAEAVDVLVEGHGFDVVLMDCRMPRMDGFDATRAIRARETDTHVPIIAMTASALPGERDRCLDAGMDDFLTKPVDPAQLASAVARAGAVGHQGPPPVPDAASPSRPQVPEGALDLDRVELLSELVKDGVSFFERTRMSFLSRIDGALAQISIAVEDGDAVRTASDAHQLRGSSLNLGLVRVGAAAEAIEELARSGNLRGADAALAVLRDAVGEGVEALAAVGRL
jgi:two-component system sensor histidine kinase/response regulator